MQIAQKLRIVQCFQQVYLKEKILYISLLDDDKILFVKNILKAFRRIFHSVTKVLNPITPIALI